MNWLPGNFNTHERFFGCVRGGGLRSELRLTIQGEEQNQERETAADVANFAQNDSAKKKRTENGTKLARLKAAATKAEANPIRAELVARLIAARRGVHSGPAVFAGAHSGVSVPLDSGPVYTLAGVDAPGHGMHG